MRLSQIALCFMVMQAPIAAFGQAPAATTGSTQHFTTSDTQLGDILDDPAAKAVLDKYAPQVSKGDQVDMARGMTLQSMQQYAPDVLSDKVLAEIDAGFAKLPPKK